MSTHAQRTLRPWTAAVVAIGFCAGAWAIPVAAQPQPGNLPPARPTPDNAADSRAATPPAAEAPPAAPRSDSGYLGIVGNDQQENGTGVRIVEIETAGPAENGGLKEDDLITKVNGTPIHSTADMGKIIEPLPVGSKVTFDVDRAGKKQTFQVTLGKRPPPDQRRFAQFGQVKEQPPEGQPGELPAANPGGPNLAGPRTPPADTDKAADKGPGPRLFNQPLPGAGQPRRQLLGVRTQPVTEEIRRRLSLPVANGAWVVSRTLGSAAEKAGIPLDAVITAVDKAPITSPQDLSRQVSQAGAGHAIELTYFSRGQFHHASVTLADIAGQAPLAGAGPALAPADAPPELPPPPLTPPGNAPPPGPAANAGAQPFPPKSTQAQIEELQHQIDDLNERVRKLEGK
jgi:hypothetical protein